MATQTELRLDDQLCFALYAASNSVVRAYRPLLAEIGLTYPQYLVMMALWERDGLPINDLARRCDLPGNSVTPMVRRLAGAGFVRRCSDPADGRVVMVFLTADGVRLERTAVAAQNSVLEGTGLSPGGQASLKSVLHELAATTAAGAARSAASVAP